jgi:hypothetical protein
MNSHVRAVKFFHLYIYHFLCPMQTLATKRSVYSVSHIDSSYIHFQVEALNSFKCMSIPNIKLQNYEVLKRLSDESGNPMAVSMFVNATYRNVPEPFHFKLTIF